LFNIEETIDVAKFSDYGLEHIQVRTVSEKIRKFFAHFGEFFSVFTYTLCL